MLHASSPSTKTAADSFFSRLHAQRSLSYDAGAAEVLQRDSVTAAGESDSGQSGTGEAGAADPSDVVRTAATARSSAAAALFGDVGEVRRAKTLRAPGRGDAPRGLPTLGGVGLPSFTAVGSTLSSPTPSVAAGYTPPAAARHPLFAHHASPPQAAQQAADGQPTALDIRQTASASLFSDSGPSVPPSPTSISSSAFSPASAFLSHFSSSTSLRPGSTAPAPDAPGAKVLNYTLGKILGRGGFSTVRLATRDDGEVFACKIVKRDDLSDRSGSLEKFEEEIKTWQSLPKHPSLLQLLEVHREGKITYLFIPFMPGGNLLDVLRRENGSEKTARKWFPGVVAAVAALHEGYGDFKGGLLHGDLKLDNFLVDHNGSVKVSDFYMAQAIKPPVSVPPPQAVAPPQRRGRPGPRFSSPYPVGAHDPVPAQLPASFPSASLPYAPPELLRAPPSEPTLAQDIWALGIILHALLTGKLPFMDEFDPRLQLKILKGQYDEPLHLGREWLEVLRGCLEGERDRRWDIKRVRESDAVIGWTEVKPKQRSKSRSRSRAPAHGRMQGFDPRTGRSDQAHPRHHWPGSSSSAAGSHFPSSIDPPKSASYVPRQGGNGVIGGDGGDDMFTKRPPRSRSASASRSRSSGRNKVFGFEPQMHLVDKDHHNKLSERLETIDLSHHGRGRSTVKRDNPSGVPDLFFGRQSRDQSTNSTTYSPHRPYHGQIGTPSRPSRSPSANSTIRSAIPSASGRDNSRCRSNSNVTITQQPFLGSSTPSDASVPSSRSRSRSRTNHSPSATRRSLASESSGQRPSGSRSRSRTAWDESRGWADSNPGGHLLGVVDEEMSSASRGQTKR